MTVSDIEKKRVDEIVNNSLSSWFYEYADGTRGNLKLRTMGGLVQSASDNINASLSSSGVKLVTNVEFRQGSIGINFKKGGIDILDRRLFSLTWHLSICNDVDDLFRVSLQTRQLPSKSWGDDDYKMKEGLKAEEVIAELPKYALLLMSADERREWNAAIQKAPAAEPSLP